MRVKLNEMAKEAYMLRDLCFFDRNRDRLDWHQLQQWFRGFDDGLTLDEVFVDRFKDRLNLVWMDDEGRLSETSRRDLEGWLDSERELQNDAFDEMYGC